jgi:uncharacterized protein (DUF697 family)
MKKKLPKAVLRTANEMHEQTDEAAPSHQHFHPADLNELRREEAMRDSSFGNNVIDIVKPKTETASASPIDSDVVRRRAKAIAIVERHANYSAIGGVIPLPIANMASITAIVVRMIKSLSKLYDVPFEHTRTRATVIGLMGGVMPTGLATIATSMLAHFVPGYNLLGLAASSITASAYARSIGHLFIEHFENGSTLPSDSSMPKRFGIPKSAGF